MTYDFEVKKNFNSFKDFVNMENLQSIKNDKLFNFESMLRLMNNNMCNYNNNGSMMNRTYNNCRHNLPFTINSSIFNTNGISMCKFNNNFIENDRLINNACWVRNSDSLSNTIRRFALD
jgi:hypothetical protein